MSRVGGCWRVMKRERGGGGGRGREGWERHDRPLMGTAVAGRVGSRVDMDPDTAPAQPRDSSLCVCVCASV